MKAALLDPPPPPPHGSCLVHGHCFAGDPSFPSVCEANPNRTIFAQFLDRDVNAFVGVATEILCSIWRNVKDSTSWNQLLATQNPALCSPRPRTKEHK